VEQNSMNRRTLPAVVLTMLACLIPAFVAADPCAVASDPTSTGYAYGTELQAAVAAVGLYLPAAVLAEREFTGAILKSGDCFTYTVLAGSRSAREVSGWVHIPGGAEIVGYWHADHSGAVKVIRPPGRALVSR
jgi:hypothetical protein